MEIHSATHAANYRSLPANLGDTLAHRPAQPLFAPQTQADLALEVPSSQCNNASNLLAAQGKPHMCFLCPKAFKRAKTLNVHLKSAHSDQTLTCLKCPQVFKRRDVYLRHQREQHGQQAGCSMCHQCGKYIRPRAMASYMTSKACTVARLPADLESARSLAVYDLSLAGTWASLSSLVDPLLVLFKLFDQLSPFIPATGVGLMLTWPVGCLPPEILDMMSLAYRATRHAIGNVRPSTAWRVSKALSLMAIAGLVVNGIEEACLHMSAYIHFRSTIPESVGLWTFRRHLLILHHFLTGPRYQQYPPSHSSTLLRVLQSTHSTS